MEKLEIDCPGHQGADIYRKLKDKLADVQKQGKISQLKDISFNDSACEAVATGTGFKSVIKCQDNKVVVNLDLNFLLKPLRSQIEEMIRKTVSKVLT